MQIIKDVIKNRQTVKEYNDKKISDTNLQLILDTIQWAPSSHGWKPYRVVVIDKGLKLRAELFPFMWNQKNSAKLW